MDLTKYLFRQSGSSCRFFTLPSVPSLQPAERLMALTLSRSSLTEEFLASQTSETINVFLKLLFENELGGYVLESFSLLGLETKARAITLNHDGVVTDFFTVVSRQSAQEAIKFDKFDNKFVQFLDLTAELREHIVWSKGIVTSRTCYSDPAQRLSGDFDCFINRKYLSQLNAILYADDFHVIVDDNGFCNQLGVGPVDSLENLFLVPDEELVPSAVMGYFKNRCPILDVKFNPLDRGLKMIELDRFEHDAMYVSWRGHQFLSPCLLDQLLVSLTHLEKDRFVGWKQLLDIKLLAEKINAEPEHWKEFIRRCKVEGVSTACCAGLSLANDRLALLGLEDVIAELGVIEHGMARRFLTFTVTPLFYWNTSSFPMLLANAAVSDDWSRKFSVLRSCFLPDRSFLSAYYFGHRQLNSISYLLILILHWFVVILPGGVIRRTFGPAIWRDNQFGS